MKCSAFSMRVWGIPWINSSAKLRKITKKPPKLPTFKISRNSPDSLQQMKKHLIKTLGSSKPSAIKVGMSLKEKHSIVSVLHPSTRALFFVFVFLCLFLLLLIQISYFVIDIFRFFISSLVSCKSLPIAKNLCISYVSYFMP